MSHADIITVAAAIVAELNATGFSLPFTARRSYLPMVELESVGVLAVTVACRGDEITLHDRNMTQHDMTFEIGIQQKLANLTSSEIDPLVYLTQQIGDHFRFGKLPGNATLVSQGITILYYQEHLQQLRQFTSVISLTFRGWRSK